MYEWPAVDQAALRDLRCSRLTELMREQGFDHLVLSGFDNIRFATDFRSNLTYDSNYEWYAALVDGEGEATLFACDIGEGEDGQLAGHPTITRRVAAPSWQSAWAQRETYVRALARELRAAKARVVGVDVLPFEIVDALRAELDGVRFVPASIDLLRMRMVKAPDELRLIEASCEVASIAMAAAMQGFREGMTDFEVLALANDAANRCGAELISHAVIVVQSTPSKASWLPTGRRIWGSDTFFIDYGVYGAGGYASDFCRVHLSDGAPDVVRRAHSALRSALEAGAALARPGVRCSEITATVNAVLTGQGLPSTAYAMGHGIGLRLVEPPSVFRPDRMDRDETLEEGMVICIEPSTAVGVGEEVIGLKEEEQYVVTASGVRQLTRTGVDR
jgi:Xaa-Pro aminopeptidase